MKFPRNSAFTLLELLVVIIIIVVLFVMIAPKISDHGNESHLSAMLNNARQLQIATQMMAMDHLEAGVGLEWTTVADPTGARPATVAEYFDALVKNNYVSTKELRKLVTAYDKVPDDHAPTASNSCFKFFWVSDASPADQALLVTANWGPTGLDPKVAPLGRKGFVMFNKGGGGTMSSRADEASLANTRQFPSDPAKGYSLVTLK